MPALKSDKRSYDVQRRRSAMSSVWVASRRDGRGVGYTRKEIAVNEIRKEQVIKVPGRLVRRTGVCYSYRKLLSLLLGMRLRCLLFTFTLMNYVFLGCGT